jgi:hypothetical protein
MRRALVAATAAFLGICAAAPASHGVAATRVTITRWELEIPVGSGANFYRVAPGGAVGFCKSTSPANLYADFKIAGPKHVTVREIWSLNGVVQGSFRLSDLTKPVPVHTSPGTFTGTFFSSGGLAFDWASPRAGRWSLTITESGRKIGTSRVTVRSKSC